MTIRAGGVPSHPPIKDTRPRGTAVPARRDNARPAVPAQPRAPAQDTGSWLQHGACGTEAPDLFFPVSPGGTSPSSLRQITEAQTVCRRCPVLEDCRTWTLANPRMTEHGVWAGTTEEERRTARRKADRAAQRAITATTPTR